MYKFFFTTTERHNILQKIFLALSLLASLSFFQEVNAQSLSPNEQAIRQFITSQQANQLALLEKLVNINSGTANIAGVHQVGKLLQSQFQQLGFKTHWVAEPSIMHKAGTLVAEHSSTQGKRLLLIGHLDTVFPKKSSFQHFKHQGDLATGPGVLDDKGGDVVILYALKALQSIHALKKANIIVVLTGDEEESGKPTTISRKPLFAAAKTSDIALDFEEAVTTNTATVARRGITNWKIATLGHEGHSSGIFQNDIGDGAIFELTRMLNTMRIQLGHEQYLTFSPGLILGGTQVTYDKHTSQGTAFGKENVIAKSAIATGDLRFLTPAQKLKAEKILLAIANQPLRGTKTTIQFQDGIPAMPPTAANLALLQTYSQASQDLGYGPVTALDPSLRGAGDISHIASIVTANLAGLGPAGSGTHSDKETLEIKSLSLQTERAALLVYRLLQ